MKIEKKQSTFLFLKKKKRTIEEFEVLKKTKCIVYPGINSEPTPLNANIMNSLTPSFITCSLYYVVCHRDLKFDKYVFFYKL